MKYNKIEEMRLCRVFIAQRKVGLPLPATVSLALTGILKKFFRLVSRGRNPHTNVLYRVYRPKGNCAKLVTGRINTGPVTIIKVPFHLDQTESRCYYCAYWLTG